MRSCCGKAHAPARSLPALTPTAAAVAPSRPPDVSYVYTGERGLATRGAITGRTYRFDRPGAVVAVDARDAPGLAAVPLLRRAPR